MTQTRCRSNLQAFGGHCFAPSQTGHRRVVIGRHQREWREDRARGQHTRELSIGTATWTVHTAEARQAVPDQWLSLKWV